MAEERAQRHLAAILAADVVGYSRLMGRDEAGTLATLKSLRADVFEPKTRQYRGRIFKIAGDSALCEFPSAVDAVLSAMEIQRILAARNADLPAERRVVLRIGISLGDVIAEGSDLYGNGVNIAARLEGLSEPGGICVSANVIEHLHAAVDCGFEDLGEQDVKNIERPVRAYRILSSSRASTASSPPERTLALPDKPSIAVLPFNAMGGDAALETFCDGLTEDIITGLSRIKALAVIARNTMFTYKGRATDLRTLGRDLGARYVLEGSVRKAGERHRATAQLIEAETGHHIWATTIDRAGADLFALQDDFMQSVVASVQTQLILSEGEAIGQKGNTSGRVRDLLARARQRHYDLTAQALNDLVSLAKRVLDLDPGNGEACRLMATGIWLQALHGFVPWDQAAADQVMSLAQRSVVAEHADEYAHLALGLAHLMAGQHDRAIVSLRRALDLNPNCSMAYGSTGTVWAWAGEPERSIDNNELALRMNPADPTVAHRHFGLALAHYIASRYARALDHAALAIQLRPGWWLGIVIHAASLAQLGRITEAEIACAELRRGMPDMTIAKLNALPFATARDRSHVAEGLRKAGLPE